MNESHDCELSKLQATELVKNQSFNSALMSAAMNYARSLLMRSPTILPPFSYDENPQKSESQTFRLTSAKLNPAKLEVSKLKHRFTPYAKPTTTTPLRTIDEVPVRSHENQTFNELSKESSSLSLLSFPVTSFKDIPEPGFLTQDVSQYEEFSFALPKVLIAVDETSSDVTIPQVISMAVSDSGVFSLVVDCYFEIVIVVFALSQLGLLSLA
ncbi:unnamed protein product [Soboliphyme baturini]|uniref:Ski_Sno domain-containing protein n=1 Tax=Soboliphyme baturini TaxID=241478 RepID=A0A183ICX0_9BILA|nr:unnamed protein product [Soboliphyme baturini]